MARLNPNVALVVLDTLREDYSGGLDELRKMGYVRYDGAISAASWTLPSHVSMFTGLPPSEHGVHEARGLSPSDIQRLSGSVLRASQQNLLNLLSRRGYRSYCMTENPFISPRCGFDFDFHGEYHYYGRLGKKTAEILFETSSPFSKLRRLARSGELGTVATVAPSWLKIKLKTALHGISSERGSESIFKDLKRLSLPSPFFLFLNFMEAHGPYYWGDDFEALCRQAILGRAPPGAGKWDDVYGRHARLAIMRAMESAAFLERYDPLVIVTSDHGQLLGEGGLYGHGTFLEDALLRVPLYVRYPSGVEPLRQEKSPVSLLEISKIVTSVLSATRAGLGSDCATSESFGPMVDVSRDARAGDEDRLNDLYADRTKLYSARGGLLYNRTKGTVEKSDASLPSDDVSRLTEAAKTTKQPTKTVLEAPMSDKDEEVAANRLRQWGYE